jgi:hypothetical protein
LNSQAAQFDSAAPDSASDLAARIARPFRVVEDWFGFFFANVVTIGIAGIAEYLLEDLWRAGGLRRAGFLALVVLWLALDLPYLLRLWRNVLKQVPHPVLAVATNARMWPLPIRPLIAAWWLAHFAAVAVMICFVPAGGELAIGRVTAFFLSTCFGFVANGYLIMATASMFKSDRLRRKVWRARVLIDLAVGAVSFLTLR